MLRPAIGEDTAALDLADELLLASSDPITGAEDKAGWLAVKVAINDIAATGGEPICILVTLLLPETALLSDLEQIIDDINEACLEEGVQVAGGHTEVTQGLKQPLISITALGKTRNRRVLSSSNAKVGDDIVVTKWAGMEGTSILVRILPRLLQVYWMRVQLNKPRAVLHDQCDPGWQDSCRSRRNVRHDATEGGVLGAIYEMCQASGLGAVVYADKIPVLPVTLKEQSSAR